MSVLPLEQNYSSTVRGGFIALPLTGLSVVLPLSAFLWELASLDPMFKSDTFVVAALQERINHPRFPEGFVFSPFFFILSHESPPLQQPFLRSSQLVAMFSGTFLQLLCVPSLLCGENAQTDGVSRKS